MQLEQNEFTRAIAQGDTQIGLWVSLCNNYAADVIALAGYDWSLLADASDALLAKVKE